MFSGCVFAGGVISTTPFLIRFFKAIDVQELQVGNNTLYSVYAMLKPSNGLFTVGSIWTFSLLVAACTRSAIGEKQCFSGGDLLNPLRVGTEFWLLTLGMVRRPRRLRSRSSKALVPLSGKVIKQGLSPAVTSAARVHFILLCIFFDFLLNEMNDAIKMDEFSAKKP